MTWDLKAACLGTKAMFSAKKRKKLLRKMIFSYWFFPMKNKKKNQI